MKYWLESILLLLLFIITLITINLFLYPTTKKDLILINTALDSKPKIINHDTSPKLLFKTKLTPSFWFVIEKNNFKSIENIKKLTALKSSESIFILFDSKDYQTKIIKSKEANFISRNINWESIPIYGFENSKHLFLSSKKVLNDQLKLTHYYLITCIILWLVFLFYLYLNKILIS